MPENRIRVMIVDDYAIVRERIAEVLEHSGGSRWSDRPGTARRPPIWSGRSCPTW